MAKIKIELEAEALVKLVRENLEDSLSSLKDDLRRRKKGHSGYGIYHTDKDEDIKALKKVIKAYQLVLKDYTVETE